MLPDNELVRQYHKTLSKSLEITEERILAGPSTDINSDEVAMEYFKKIGRREALKDALTEFESISKAFFGITE
jgi:hypothetical protein